MSIPLFSSSSKKSADDELILRSIQVNDPSLEVTREQFNTQYLVWPIREDLDPTTLRLLKKWMYAAISNATNDELYFQYCKHRTSKLLFTGLFYPILICRYHLFAFTFLLVPKVQKTRCPVGTAGENCELPCDPEHGAANVAGICVCESSKWIGG